jgi:NAD(P)-dependent dehydrogenase (short-subunit alcohol dehydrogenase family)
MSGLIIVTGGARGIGAATCLALAAAGHAIAVNYASDRGAAEATAAAIVKSGGRARAFRADVADPQAIAKLFEDAVGALGPLAGLVNNAGVLGEFARVDALDPVELTRLFQVNVIGTMLCAKEAVRRLSTLHGGPGGAIVNISSVAARTGGLPSRSPYAATKGAIETFTRGLANEVGREGIRVNAVAPGMIETDMSSPILSSPAVKEQIASSIPIGRLGAPEEIAEAIAWLISPASRYVTGSVMTVSGGR